MAWLRCFVLLKLQVHKVSWAEATFANFEAVLAGSPLPLPGYDSDDDPEVLVSKRIEVRRTR